MEPKIEVKRNEKFPGWVDVRSTRSFHDVVDGTYVPPTPGHTGGLDIAPTVSERLFQKLEAQCEKLSRTDPRLKTAGAAMKPFVLTDKEKKRAENGYVVVSRPDPKGGYTIAIVEVSTGKMKSSEHADDKQGIAAKTKELLRWVDKAALPGPKETADKSRSRKKGSGWDNGAITEDGYEPGEIVDLDEEPLPIGEGSQFPPLKTNQGSPLAERVASRYLNLRSKS